MVLDGSWLVADWRTLWYVVGIRYPAYLHNATQSWYASVTHCCLTSNFSRTLHTRKCYATDQWQRVVTTTGGEIQDRIFNGDTRHVVEGSTQQNVA